MHRPTTRLFLPARSRGKAATAAPARAGTGAASETRSAPARSTAGPGGAPFRGVQRAGHALRVLCPAVAIVLAFAFAPAHLAAQERDAATPAAVPALVEVAEGGREVAALRLTVDALDGIEVFGRDDERIGDVETVLATWDGAIVALSLELGGFLGLGERTLVMPIDSFRRVGDLLVLDVTLRELRELPE